MPCALHTLAKNHCERLLLFIMLLYAHWSPSFYFRFPLIMKEKSLLCFTIYLIPSKKTSTNEKKAFFSCIVWSLFQSPRMTDSIDDDDLLLIFLVRSFLFFVFSIFAKHFHRASSGASSWVPNVLRVHCHFTRTRLTHSHTRARTLTYTRANAHTMNVHMFASTHCVYEIGTHDGYCMRNSFLCALSVASYILPSRDYYGVWLKFSIRKSTAEQYTNKTIKCEYLLLSGCVLLTCALLYFTRRREMCVSLVSFRFVWYDLVCVASQ